MLVSCSTCTDYCTSTAVTAVTCLSITYLLWIGLLLTSLDFYCHGILLLFVEIMSDKVILDYKKSYLVLFENFYSL